MDFIKNSQAMARTVEHDRKLQQDLFSLLLSRFTEEQQRNFYHLPSYPSGHYRGILEVHSVLPGSIIRHSICSNYEAQPSIYDDTHEEYFAFALLDSLGVDVPSYLVRLDHPSVRKKVGITQTPRGGGLLSLYEIVGASQLLPDLSDGDRYKVTEIIDTSQWRSDASFVKTVCDHFDEAEEKLGKYGVSLLKPFSNRDRYDLYAECSFACIDSQGKVQRVVFGDAQRFSEMLRLRNSPENLRRLPIGEFDVITPSVTLCTEFIAPSQ